ncbi:MAG: hypothetical protein RMK89_09390 [Armatimonadota bacterium]|nr:type II secretion system protein GspG [Armatimonadota bacterium]MDW8143660.1 hypothetical protein [Armatimonadota bacterium]
MASIALRLYHHENGRYPESLRELVPKYLPSVPVDPFSNKPIQHRRTQKGFFVWSIGWDGKDDGGSLRLDEDNEERHRLGKFSLSELRWCTYLEGAAHAAPMFFLSG